MNSAIASNTGTFVGYSFAIPSNLVRAVTEQIIAEGRVQRAVMGISIQDVSPEAAEYVDLNEIRGVLVTGFPPDSRARRAGLQRGDVIVALDGDRVDRVSQLQQLVVFREPGETVQVTVRRRGGAQATYDVRLSEYEGEVEPEPEETDEEPAFIPTSGAGRIGIEVDDLSDQQRRHQQLRDLKGIGVLVTQVSAEGPASRLLFPPDNRPTIADVITAIDGQPVRSAEQLQEIFDSKPAGSVVALDVHHVDARNGQSDRIVHIRIARRK